MKWVKASERLPERGNYKESDLCVFKKDDNTKLIPIYPFLIKNIPALLNDLDGWLWLDESDEEIVFKKGQPEKAEGFDDEGELLLPLPAGDKTDFQIGWELAFSKDKPFFIDNIKKLLNSYDGEEISFSKFVEELNVAAIKWRDLSSKHSPGYTAVSDEEMLKQKVYYGMIGNEQKMVIHYDDALSAIQQAREDEAAKWAAEIGRLKGDSLDKISSLNGYLKIWKSGNNTPLELDALIEEVDEWVKEQENNL